MKSLVVAACVVGLAVLGFGGVPIVQDLDWDCVRPVYIVAGDLDGNGWDDIAVACHSCNTVHLGLNPGTKVCPVLWPKPKVFSLADSPVVLAWGLFLIQPVTYETRLVTATQYLPAWAAFTVPDPPTVKLTTFPGVTATHLTLGDFNEDGVLDVAILDSLGLKIFFPKVEIPTIDIAPYAQICNVAFLATGDFDREGDLDLVVASNNSLLFFENVGAGQFAFKMSLVLGHMLRGIAVADLDIDGKPDLAVVDPAFAALTILRNVGCWKFEIIQRIKMDGEPVFVVTADFTRDGKVDLAVAEYAKDRVTLFSNLDGKFKVEGYVAVGKNPISLAVGDFDRNAISDLAVALYGGGPGGVGPAVQVIYNPLCAKDDCTREAPCCKPGVLPKAH